MSKKLYIGNLSFSVRDEDLSDAFASFGNITSVRVVTDRETGRSKGFGFVEYETEDAAQAAIEGMNGKELAGRPVNVSEARPQTDRPRTGGGGGFRRGPRPGGGGGGGGFRGRE
jgi:RNA recognition motif-containing protein